MMVSLASLATAAFVGALLAALAAAASVLAVRRTWSAAPRRVIHRSGSRGGARRGARGTPRSGNCLGDGLPPPLYRTEDVDPLIVGNMYDGAREHSRYVYDARRAHGAPTGLSEYATDSGPGAVGVDIGALGRADCYDDGLPAAWVLPSTPVGWYRPERADYYGPEGATPWTEGLYSLYEPDHDPLIGADADEGPATLVLE